MDFMKTWKEYRVIKIACEKCGKLTSDRLIECEAVTMRDLCQECYKNSKFVAHYVLVIRECFEEVK